MRYDWAVNNQNMTKEGEGKKLIRMKGEEEKYVIPEKQKTERKFSSKCLPQNLPRKSKKWKEFNFVFSSLEFLKNWMKG